MTVKDTMAAMADASDAGAPKVGIYQPALTHATRRKNGDVVITLKLVTNDLTVEDVVDGVTAWLAIGRTDAIRKLQDPA